MIPPEIKEWLAKTFNNQWSMFGLLILLILLTQVLLFWFPRDNAIEQEVEELIREETGLSLDLSP